MFKLNLKNLFGKKIDQGIQDSVSGFSSQFTEINPLSNISAETRQDTNKLIETGIYYLLIGLIFATPLLTVPVITEWFDLPKTSLLLLGSLAGFLAWSVKNIVVRKFNWTKTPFDLPIIIFVAVSIVSASLTGNIYTSLLSDPVLYLGSALTFFLLTNSVTKVTSLMNIVKTVLIAGSVIGAWSIIQTVYNIAATSMKLSTNVVVLLPNFSLTGSPLSQITLLVLLVPLAFGFYLATKERGSKNDKTISVTVLGLIIAGVITTAYAIIVTKPIFIPVDTGWRIATATLSDSTKAAFLGTGPGNFVDAFSVYKPTTINATNLWNLRFSNSSNYYFYVITTLGLGGIIAFGLLVVKLAKMIKSRINVRGVSQFEKSLLTSLGATLVAIAVVPASVTTIFLFFALLGILMAHYKISEVEITKQIGDVRYDGEIRLALVALSLFSIVASGYYLGRVLIADYYMNASLTAARNNQGSQTYSHQVTAIYFNPWNDGYRTTFAQTNLALADSLASQANLTDQQRQAIVQLVQQAIREGRNAVSLQPQRAANWENLSLIYRNLINFAQGADQWSVVTQNQAINLDPVNPRLRLDLGGIYYALGNYQIAAQLFTQAANLKPDFANAHYNLAQALKQLKLNDQALAQLQLTASLVCAQGSKTAADCERVNNEITNLGSTPASPSAGLGTEEQAKIAPATPSSGLNLPKAKTTPPVELGSPSATVTR